MCCSHTQENSDPRTEVVNVRAFDLHLTRMVNPDLAATLRNGRHEGVGRIAERGSDAT